MRKENRQTIHDELREMGCHLPEDGSQKAYKLPPDYFDTLPGIIQQRVAAERKPPVIWLYRLDYKKVVPLFAAAVVIVALSVGIFFHMGNQHNALLVVQEELPDMEYFANHFLYDKDFFYQVVYESELGIDEILYGLNDGDEIAGNGTYDELMEELFEEAQYYGMDSKMLLSYLY